MSARRICLNWKLPFTTRLPHPVSPSMCTPAFGLHSRWRRAMPSLRRFHNAGNGIMVATETVRQTLEKRGFNNLSPWSRPRCRYRAVPPLKSAALMAVSTRTCPNRSSPISAAGWRWRRNIEAFLDLDLPGSRFVGRARPAARRAETQVQERYTLPAASLVTRLAQHFADADVSVFPKLHRHLWPCDPRSHGLRHAVAAFVAPGPKDNHSRLLAQV